MPPVLDVVSDTSSEAAHEEIGLEEIADADIDVLDMLGYDWLSELPGTDSHSRGLENLGNTCYGNSMLRALAVLPLVNAWAHQHNIACNSKGNCVLCSLHHDLKALRETGVVAHRPLVMLSRARWAPALAGRGQHCAHDAWCKLMESCNEVDRRCLHDLRVPFNLGTLYALPSFCTFGYKLRSTTKCRLCEKTTVTLSDFEADRLLRGIYLIGSG